MRSSSSRRDDFGDRMKSYEYQANKDKLIPNLPVIVRLDGKSFSKFTKDFEKPFDKSFAEVMKETTRFLVNEFPKCILGYTQSDEISLVFINDYNNPIEFSGRIQKLCSIIASKCSCFFCLKANESPLTSEINTEDFPVFDCRIWNVPSVVEASNTIFWREVDATKNSIQSLGQYYMYHKDLQGLSNNQVQFHLNNDYDVNWNDLEDHYKKGSYYIKNSNLITKRLDTVEVLGLPPLKNLTLEERLFNLFPTLYNS